MDINTFLTLFYAKAKLSKRLLISHYIARIRLNRVLHCIALAMKAGFEVGYLRRSP